jgi:hypothetical protein
VKAWYDAQHGLVMFELKNGCVFGFPPKGDGYPLLNHATPEQLAQVEFVGDGAALHWKEIDGAVSVRVSCCTC